MKAQISDARLPGNALVPELADRGLLADPQLQGLAQALLEKLGFDPEWVTALARAN